jgi:hypothetical protein
MGRIWIKHAGIENVEILWIHDRQKQEVLSLSFRPILEELEATPVPSDDALLLIASPAFQTFRILCDRVINYLKSWPKYSEPFGFSNYQNYQGLQVNNETLGYWNKLVKKYGD